VCDSDLHVVRQFGELPATLKTMANDAVQAKDPARAIAYYKIAMEMEPQDIGLLSGIARASELGGELVGAQEAWRQVLAVDPTHPEALEHFSLLADRLSQAESSPLKAAAKRGHFFWISLFLLVGLLGGAALLSKSGRIVTPAPVQETLVKQELARTSSSTIGNPEAANQPAQSNDESTLLYPNTSAKLDIDKVKAELPSGIQFQTSNGGVFLSGVVPSLREKQVLELKAKTWNSAFVDLTQVYAASPTPIPADAPASGDESTSAMISKAETFVRHLTGELPAGIQARAEHGGVYLSGSIRYPWEREDLEAKSKTWDCTFVDMSGVQELEPRAFLYRAKRGDTLRSLAKTFLGRAELWPVLFEANSSRLSQPGKLQAGQVIVLHWTKPQLKTTK
jgi:nucleoid-associated protein YgaU